MIRIKEVTKRFGKLVALNKVDAELRMGACIALIGPNGSGKTTLVKALLGMNIPEGGCIEFGGKNILSDWQYRERIGYMPQIGRYPENMTIGQVIKMMKDIRSQNRSGAMQSLDEELLNSYHLDALSSKAMGTLSGGTTQKVSASLAFMFNPDVLILDEPTAGLDPLASEILKDKIQREKEKGKLIIITSHILSELDELVTEVMYMQDSELRFHKAIESLREQTKEQKLSKAIAKVMALN